LNFKASKAIPTQFWTGT